MRASLFAVAGVVALALWGCGGGGDDRKTFEVSASSLSFTAKQNDPLPASKTLTVRVLDSKLVYGSGWADPQPTWITEPTFASFPLNTTVFNHIYAVSTTNLAPGTYTATLELRVSEPATGGLKLVEKKTVPVTYTVTAP